MTIGNLVVQLGMNHAGFDSGVSKVQAGLGTVNTGVQKLGGFAGGLWAKLAGLAGIAAFSVMTESALGSIDATAKLADSLGTTTETMVGLQHASDLSGNSQEDLAKGMFKLQKGLGTIEAGGKGPADAFERLGLQFEDIAHIDTGAAFVEVADKISQLESPALQTATAMEIFGKAGVNLLPLLREGKDGLEGLIAETETLGTSFSRIDAAKVEEANDAMTRMKAAVMGVAQQTAIGLAPAITYAADSFASLAPMAGEAFRWMSDFAMDSFTVIGWGFVHLPEMAEYAFASMQLGFVSLWNDALHLFGTNLPELINWFGQEFVNLNNSYVDGVLTIFINMGTNIRSIFSALWEYIASGGQTIGKVAWTPLLEGFHNSVGKLPEFTQRGMSDLEQNLTKEIASLGGSLGDSLGESMAESWEARKPKLNETPEKMGLMPEPNEGKDTKKKGASAASGPAALQVGSSEALSAIVKAAGAQTSAKEDYSKKMADKQFAETKKQSKFLQEIAASVGDGQTTEEVDI